MYYCIINLVQRRREVMGWKFNQERPIYQQIIAHIELMILAGDYKPGDKIESVREFAAIAGVNPNTMQKALQEMESMGLINTKRTSGRYITDDEGKIKDLRNALAREKTENYMEELQKLGYNIEEIKKLILAYQRPTKAVGNLADLMKGEL